MYYNIVFFKVNCMITDYSFLASFTFLKCHKIIPELKGQYEMLTF